MVGILLDAGPALLPSHFQGLFIQRRTSDLRGYGKVQGPESIRFPEKLRKLRRVGGRKYERG